MGLGHLIRNVQSRGLADILDPQVRAAYGEWKEIEKNGLHLDADELLSFAEQIVFRTRKCEGCVRAGECVEGEKPCHCPMPAKALTPLAKCSAGRWPEYKSPADWEEYKTEKGINILALD